MKTKRKKENRLVVGSLPWADCIPDWVKEEIKTERIMLGLIGIAADDFSDSDNSDKVGDAEVVAYLMTASLAAPLPHTLTEIYLYLATKVMERKGKTVPNDIRKTELSRYEEQELKGLKYTIYRARGGDIQHPLLNAMRELKRRPRKFMASKKSDGTLFDM